jgi:hypothetical protein
MDIHPSMEAFSAGSDHHAEFVSVELAQDNAGANLWRGLPE